MPIYEIDGWVPVIEPGAFVHPTAVLIGDVFVGAGCYVGPGASLRGDFGAIILEPGSNLQDNCIMHSFPGAEARVEVDGHIGHGAVLHGCLVKRNALVGMNSVVMDKAVVGEEAFVAAMSFVKAGFEVPPRTLVAGTPAKIIRPLTDQEIDWKSRGTAEYQELSRRSNATLRPCEPLSAPSPERREKASRYKTLQDTKKGG